MGRIEAHPEGQTHYHGGGRAHGPLTLLTAPHTGPIPAPPLPGKAHARMRAEGPAFADTVSDTQEALRRLLERMKARGMPL